MARMGMDADAVESAGRALKERAGQIDAIVSNLDRSVKGLLNIWDGQDAQTFVHTWWPEHRALLVTARGHVDGLGQSALNNASEQRGVSDVKGDHGGGTTQPNGGGGGTTPPGGSGGGAISQGAGFQDWKSSVVGPNGVGPGKDIDGASGIQCVDAVKDYAQTIYPGTSWKDTIGTGNANQLFDGSNPEYWDKLPKTSTPQAGDIICIGGNYYSPDNGHIAIVQSYENGVMTVVQQDGNNPDKGMYVGQISKIEMDAVQGYLRPKH